MHKGGRIQQHFWVAWSTGTTSGKRGGGQEPQLQPPQNKLGVVLALGMGLARMLVQFRAHFPPFSDNTPIRRLNLSFALVRAFTFCLQAPVW